MEGLSLLQGMRAVQSRGIEQCSFYSDSEVLVQSLTNPQAPFLLPQRNGPMNTEVKQRKVANQRQRASRPNERTRPEEHGEMPQEQVQLPLGLSVRFPRLEAVVDESPEFAGSFDAKKRRCLFDN
ncbi:hypothetical protein FCM35_KLT18758 [Carex littledalei]|uniref:Uncharacterized protein n=1 Tax=Carex littledalei TaxID=544730 RepID=A0A833RD66_9POAL|nr:hypothetical protein FCM35_KLT18758 [Carex littledalei]